MTGSERAAAAARDPDGYFARVRAESEALAAAEMSFRDRARAAEVRRRVARMTGLGLLAQLMRRLTRRRA